MKNIFISKLIIKIGFLLLAAAAVFLVVFSISTIRQMNYDRSLQAMRNSTTDRMIEDVVDTGLFSDRAEPDLYEIDQEESSSNQVEAVNPFSSSSVDLKFERNKFQDLFTRNDDFVGWIQIAQTRIDYPIVKGRDNTYYLDRNFDRQQRKNGSIFMDYRNSGTWQDRHTIVYGHHTRDGTMFTDLLKFRQPSFYDQNRDLVIESLFSEIHYKIFAAYITEADPAYIRTIFDESSFNDFISEIKDNNFHVWDTEIGFGDQILTFSTCAYDFTDARMVVHAVRINE